MAASGEEEWDPLADPADLAGAGGSASAAAVSSSDAGTAADAPREEASQPLQAHEDPALEPFVGPLGREVALSSGRMRDIEAWLVRAEAAGLPARELAPARERLLLLGQSNKALQWEAEERRKKQEREAEEERKKAELLRMKEKEVAAEQLRRAEAAEVPEELKAAIMRAFHAGLDVKTLIRARHKLMEIEGRPKPAPPPTVKPALRKEDLAKEMLQAMKRKDLVALRSVLDMATESGVQLPGLQAARAKLVEWEKANPQKAAPKSEPKPDPQEMVAPEPPKPQPRLAQAKPRTSGVVGPDGLMPLRVVLPDGRRGWLEVSAADNGVAVLKLVLPLRDRSGKVMTDLRFFLGEDLGAQGKVRCFRELQMDKPIYAQGFQAGTLLCIRNDVPELPAAPATSSRQLTCNAAAMARAAEVSELMQQQHQLRFMRARGIDAVPFQHQRGAVPSAPSSALWRSSLKAVTEPFPPFSTVDRLLGGGRKGTAVVVGWNATGDPAIRGRCEDALRAVGAEYLVLTGAERPRPGSLRSRESYLEVEPDGHFGSEEATAMLEHIKEVVGIQPPFLLALVSRGYISRRLAVSFQRYLPEGVPYFPCPPYDLSAVVREELPLFEAQVFDEARRLHILGAELSQESLEALDQLRPGWREHGGRAAKPAVVGAGPRWRAAFRGVCEAFPPFEVAADIFARAQSGGKAVIVGWNAALDPSVRQRCTKSVAAMGGAHLVLTGAPRPSVDLGPATKESFLALEADGTFGEGECATLLEHARVAAGLVPPFALLLVSRGYLSRRLTACFRAHLPPGVSLLPCPPADPDAACREEAPLFQAQIFMEAARLSALGIGPGREALEALDALDPDWHRDVNEGELPSLS